MSNLGICRKLIYLFAIALLFAVNIQPVSAVGIDQNILEEIEENARNSVDEDAIRSSIDKNELEQSINEDELCAEINEDELLQTIDEEELRSRINEDEIESEYEAREAAMSEEEREPEDITSATFFLKQHPIDVIDIEVPVVGRTSPLDYIIDPDGLIYATDAAKYGGGVVEENAYLLFRNSDGDYLFSSRSDMLEVTNRSNVSAIVYVTARLEGESDIQITDKENLNNQRKPSIYFALIDNEGNEIPLDENGEAVIEIELNAAPEETYAYEWNEETQEYDYVKTMEIDESEFDTYRFGVVGACNSEGNWDKVTNMPTIQLEWSAEAVETDWDTIKTQKQTEDEIRLSIEEAKKEVIRKEKIEEYRDEELQKLIEDKLLELKAEKLDELFENEFERLKREAYERIREQLINEYLESTKGSDENSDPNEYMENSESSDSSQDDNSADSGEPDSYWNESDNQSSSGDSGSENFDSSEEASSEETSNSNDADTQSSSETVENQESSSDATEIVEENQETAPESEGSAIESQEPVNDSSDDFCEQSTSEEDVYNEAAPDSSGENVDETGDAISD